MGWMPCGQEEQASKAAVALLSAAAIRRERRQDKASRIGSNNLAAVFGTFRTVQPQVYWLALLGTGCPRTS